MNIKNQSKKIPITAIQGFLGSGKTTLLNHILQHNHRLNIGVVVNDFGDINIDAKLVKSSSEKKLELSSGCICCSLQTLDLQEAIDQFTYSDSKIDYILIEASGLAEPRDLALTLRSTIGIKVRLDSIVTVIDAKNLEQNADNQAIARDQILFSDFIVINKTDLITKQKLSQIRQMIEAFNPRARVFETIKAKLDIRLLLDQNRISNKPLSVTDESHTSHDDHLHSQYTHVTWQVDKPLDPMKFQTFCNRLLPNTVYRAKGILHFGLKGGNRKFIYQHVGVRAELSWQNWHGELAQTDLVFIGKNLDKKALLRELNNCIDTTPKNPLPDDIELKLPRYDG